MTKRLHTSFRGLITKHFRKPDGSWDLVPLVLAAVIITCAGYLYWGDKPASERPMDVPSTQLNK